MTLHGNLLLLTGLLTITVSAQVTLTASSDIAEASSAEDGRLGDSLRSYRSYTSTATVNTARISSYTDVTAESSSLRTSNATDSSSPEAASSTSSTSVTLLEGEQTPSSVLSGGSSAETTGTQGSTPAQPTNTQPCNGHPAFCSRKYSNITYVAAHNSPFVREGNAAANQELPVINQLQDGIRMLEFPTHWNESEQTFHLCHGSCDVLDAGTLESYLRTVTDWLSRHPYDIVTILMGNYDAYPPDRYIEPVVSSGLIDYVYIAPKVPMNVEDWPTLEEMIFANTRAVVMLDYEADQEKVPWLHDEFAQLFETPFSPTDRDFPCTADRPPEDWPGALPRKNRMYMANHNLNFAVSLAGFNILVPNTVLINETNSALDIEGSTERAVQGCVQKWNRPPNFLLVDYYNVGNFDGSVFQVAAEANNVPFDPSSCCGTPPENGAIAQRVQGRATPTLLVVLLLVTMISFST